MRPRISAQAHLGYRPSGFHLRRRWPSRSVGDAPMLPELLDQIPADVEIGTVTSNLPFDEWTETFGTERLTGALLDRLTHHVKILEMNGDSYRLGQSRARKAEATT